MQALRPSTIIVMCGTSFSGKSTVARQLSARLPAVVVSLDAINEERGLFGGKGIPVEEWMRTHDEASRRVRDAIARGSHAVVDDTSSHRFLRDNWRALAANVAAQFVLVFVDTPPEAIRQRHRENRETHARHDVTDAVLEEHLAGFEPPAADEDHITTKLLPTVDELIDAVRRKIAAKPLRH